MLGAVTGLLPPLDLSALLQFVATALFVAFGFLVLLKNAASRYFVVDTGFDSGGYEEGRARTMSIGRGGKCDGGGGGDGKCFVCGKDGSKLCGRCRGVRYCSLDCQTRHWKEDHKVKCKKKESGVVALVPGRGVYKVLQQPKKILFPYDEFAKLYYWEKQVFPPCGLLNCGNSCFANVVLQCLSCTRPLVGYLLEGAHSRECRRNDWCFLCELQSHIQRVTQSWQPFSPVNILSRLTNIGGHLGHGRQEDAHEFMRFAIDTMQSVCLDEFGGEKALDSSTQETSLIQHVFGGHLQSQVICTKCNVVSNRYENMMDLTVEIEGDAESLADCLDQFTAKEWLDGENMYKCDGCNDYVKALKRLTVHRAPNILTVTLKRFQSGKFGKLNKRVAFPETLNLSPYMSCAGDGDNFYTLYAVVVHLDMLNASFFGHYICYTKDFSGNWYRIDDCKVMKVELEEVLSQGAYMLLYSRLHVRQPKPLQVTKGNVLQPDEVASVSSVISESVNSKGTVIRNNISINSDTDTENEGKKNMDIDEHGASFMSKTHHNLQQVEKDVTEENSLLSKELVERKLSWTSSSCNEGKTVEHQLPFQKSQEDRLLMGKNDSTSNLEQGYVAINTNEMVHAPIISTSLSCEQENPEVNPSLSHCSNGPKLDQAIECHRPGSSSEGDKIDGGPPCDNKRTKALPGSRVRTTCVETKPLFSRGFLDKPSRKKPLHQAERAQTINYPVDLCIKNDFSEVRHSISGNSELMVSSNSLGKDVDIEGKGQTVNDEISPYKDDSNWSYSSACDTMNQNLHDHNPRQKVTIGIRRSNGYFDSPSIPNNPCGEPQMVVDVHRSDLQVNGGNSAGSAHFIETSLAKESKSALERHDAFQESICVNGENIFPEFGTSLRSNGFLDKISQESQNDIHVDKKYICDEVDCTSRSRSQVLENSQPKKSESAKLNFLNHDGCQKSVLKIGDGSPSDVYRPVLSHGLLHESHNSHNFCIEEDSLGWRPSVDVSTPWKAERGHQNHVSFQDSPCGNGTDRLRNLDVPLSTHGSLSKQYDQPNKNDIGRACLHEAGCSSITKCNGYSDPTSEQK